MDESWETEIAALLTDLADVQKSLLDFLTEKRELLAARDGTALAASAEREQSLVERLQACHARRQRLLDRASDEGLPADSIGTLSESLPSESRQRVQPDIEEARKQSRFLQHQSLTNWVLVQQSLLHLSQLLEIIATGGRLQPTYGNGASHKNSGALVDRAV